MAETTPKSVTISRLDTGVYRATNERGDTLEFGSSIDEGFSPIELLLAALAGCAAVDVDMVTSRQAEPLRFEVTATGDKVVDDHGNILRNLALEFDLAFPDGPDGDKARMRVPNAIRASHDRHCTVSRTVEAESPVEIRIEQY